MRKFFRILSWFIIPIIVGLIIAIYMRYFKKSEEVDSTPVGV